ncbi:hypothetical protein BBJ28_00023680 [Nothophytophthora sp. Chile5]|nr:hypothetical protein BBJ28_00023680 [Nothophytophthora sp. Chile5]
MNMGPDQESDEDYNAAEDMDVDSEPDEELSWSGIFKRRESEDEETGRSQDKACIGGEYSWREEPLRFGGQEKRYNSITILPFRFRANVGSQLEDMALRQAARSLFLAPWKLRKAPPTLRSLLAVMALRLVMGRRIVMKDMRVKLTARTLKARGFHLGTMTLAETVAPIIGDSVIDVARVAAQKTMDLRYAESDDVESKREASSAKPHTKRKQKSNADDFVFSSPTPQRKKMAAKNPVQSSKRPRYNSIRDGFLDDGIALEPITAQRA